MAVWFGRMKLARTSEIIKLPLILCDIDSGNLNSLRCWSVSPDNKFTIFEIQGVQETYKDDLLLFLCKDKGIIIGFS